MRRGRPLYNRLDSPLEMINVGIVGFGRIGAEHAGWLTRAEGIRAVAAFDPTPQRRALAQIEDRSANRRARPNHGRVNRKIVFHDDRRIGANQEFRIQRRGIIAFLVHHMARDDIHSRGECHDAFVLHARRGAGRIARRKSQPGVLSRYHAAVKRVGAATNVVLLSYVDDALIGINTDPAAIPDHDDFVACLHAGFDEVLAAGG